MSAIRIIPADRPGGTFTTTKLPANGLWLPVLPREIRVKPSAIWDNKNLVGVGDVPSPGGKGIMEIDFGSILPAVYTPSLCRGLPSASHFINPGEIIGHLRSLQENNDIFLLSIDEGPQPDVRFEQIPGAPVGVRDYVLQGEIIDEPMRVTGFEWGIGSFTHITYRLTLSGTQARAHLESSYWTALPYGSPVRKDPASGRTVPVRQPGTNKVIPLKAPLRPREDLRSFTIRWFGPAKVAMWKHIADYNACTVSGISKGARVDTAPLVQKLPKGRRLTSLAFPPFMRVRAK